MRALRWLLASLLLLCAAPASAKVAIIHHALRGSDADNGIEDDISAQAMTDCVTGILHEFAKQQGIPDDSLYVVIPASRVTTYMCRFGKFPRGPGSSDTLRVDAVIHPNFIKFPNNIQYGNNYRPHSMTRADTLPYVPNVLLFNAGNFASYANIGVADFRDASTCTLGVKNVSVDGVIETGADPSGTHEGERSQYQIGHPEIWFNTDYSGFYVRNTADPAGGLSVLIGTAGNSNFYVTEKWGRLTNPDSCGRSATGDSMAVWTRRNAHAAGAAELICAAAFAVDYGFQSGDEAQHIYHGINASIPNIMAALAHADSITLGKVFGKGTINVALAVTHWLSQSSRRTPGGYFPADSTNVYASLDSLAALGVPITFAVNSDSAGNYERDIIKLKEVPKAKFVPMITTGIVDTTKGTGTGAAATRVAQYARPIDPFGRYRQRPRSYGPIPPTTAAGDSSSSTLMIGALDLAANNFGRGRVSPGLWPYGEDYSPVNFGSTDSVLISAGLSGVRFIVFDPRDPEATVAGTSPRGKYAEARTMFGVKLLPRLPFNTLANRWLLEIADADSAFPAAVATAQSFPLFISQAAWGGLLGPRYSRSYGTQRDYTDNGTQLGVGYWGSGARGRILAVSAQELSGPTTAEYAMQPVGPYRVGWYGIKHFVHATRAINRLAGRSLINFTYLENL